jgi:hypothetical protein
MTKFPAFSGRIPAMLTFLLISGSLMSGVMALDLSGDLELVEVRRIWDKAPHNAFTDLEYFRGQWYCAFREGESHVRAGDYGRVRIIVSGDGLSWRTAGLLETPGYDLRDAKLSITPEGKLLLNSWEYHVDEGDDSRRTSRSLSWISEDGLTWDGPNHIGDTGYWIWQTAWSGGNGLALGYTWGEKDGTRLYKTGDGVEYQVHVDHLRPTGDHSNEHSMAFDRDGTAWMLLRRDNPQGGSATHALLGKSSPPWKDWQWQRLDYRMGGPALLALPDGRLLSCVRRYPESGGSAWTELGFIDRNTAGYTPALRLPSGGDTSYAGLVRKGPWLWVSYYSSHEEKTAIYLARIRIRSLDPLPVGTKRELFIDDYLISELSGDVRHRLCIPERSGRALEFDRPWEGVYSAYPTVLKDGDTWHLFYRGLPVARHAIEVEVTCHATSLDGIHWTRPNHQLFEWEGDMDNNIILAGHPACHNFAPFLDSRPGVDPAHRFKAFGGNDKSGLLLLTSPDGIHWTQSGDGSVFRDDFEPGWAFDSQNVGFWSESEGTYVLYYRRFIDGIRRIYRVTSTDLRNWTEPVDTMANLDGEHLYTNQTQPYFRAPHIYVGFPKRFFPGKVAIDPELAASLVDDPNYRRDTADSVLISSRSQPQYDRTFEEGFIRPGPSSRDWISRSNAAGCGVVPALDDPMKMYVYRLSHYGQPSAHLTRYTLRTDGFAAISAGASGGALMTRPVVFQGDTLDVNFNTSAGGEIRVELTTIDGEILTGFSKDDCDPLIGNDIDRQVRWKNADLSSLQNQPVRIRFILKDCELYAFRFRASEAAE